MAGSRTLSIDIGGTGIKMLVLDAAGRPQSQRARVLTPHPARPPAVLAAVRALVSAQPRFDRASVGFPGVIVDGVVATAPNLGSKFWHGYDFGRAVARLLRCPVRVCNDADMQGLGFVEGKGVEMILTLGTGVGSGLYLDGCLVPNLELGHHPFRRGVTYEEYLGRPALDEVGKKKWRRRVAKAVTQIAPIWNYRRLFLGGGNAKFLRQEDLPNNVIVVSNEAGLRGGLGLWA